MISVLIASGSQQEIGTLYAHLEATGAFRVVADAKCARTTIALAERTKPDLLVLDTSMPGIEGMQAVRALLRASPTTCIVLLTDHIADGMLEAATAAGAAGVIRRGQPLTALVEQLSTFATVTTAEIGISPEAWWVRGRSTIS